METEELLVKLEAAGNDLKKVRNILQQVNFTIVSKPCFLLFVDFSETKFKSDSAMLRLCEAGRIARVQFILQHADIVPQVTTFLSVIVHFNLLVSTSPHS